MRLHTSLNPDNQAYCRTGTIGTGLFLGSGKAITNGGPLGALIGYTLVGVLVVAPVFSIAEMSALVPLSGGVVRHAEYFFDPALSFANGWNNVYSYMVSLPAEIVAAAVIVDFWTTSVNNAVWITIFGLLLVASNIYLVRIYGVSSPAYMAPLRHCDECDCILRHVLIMCNNLAGA